MRGDLILLDRLIDNLSQARRLLQFVTPGSRDNTASTPQPHYPAETWPFYTTYRQVFHYHPDFPAVHPLPHHVPHTRRRTPTLILDRSPTTSHPGHQHQHYHSHQGTFTIPRQPLTPHWLTTSTSNLRLYGSHYAVCQLRDGIPAHGCCYFLFFKSH